MNNFAEWICDLLAQADSSEAVKMIENCGRGCAERAGTLAFMRKLRAEAPEGASLAETLEYLATKLPLRFTETEEGFITHLGNFNHCNCKMLPDVSRNTERLCECTKGYQRAMWSEFFGHPVDVEIVETVLHGGDECVFKAIL